MAKKLPSPANNAEAEYVAYQEAETKRHNTLAALARAKGYTVGTVVKPPRLNKDGSLFEGVSPLAETEDDGESPDAS